MPVTISGSGTITGIATGGLPDGSIASGDLADNAVTAGKLASSLDLTGKTVTLPSGVGGKILQVQEFTLTTLPQTNSQDSFVDVTDWSNTITPSSSSSKILIAISIGKVSKSDDNHRNVLFRIMRDIGGAGYNAVGVGAAAGSRLQASFAIWNFISDYGVSGSYMFVDSPSTTDICTYKLQWSAQAGETFYLNRSSGDTNSADTPHARTMSTMYLMEVAA